MGTEREYDDNGKSDPSSAPASFSIANLELAGHPGSLGTREAFAKSSGATSRRICGVSSDLVRIHLCEFMGFWPEHRLASLGRRAETSSGAEVMGYQPMDIKGQRQFILTQGEEQHLGLSHL